MSTISASTTSTTAYKVTADTTGTLVFQTGSTPTTAMTLGSDQSVTFAGAQTYTGAATFTSGITVQGITVGKGAASVSTNTAVGASALSNASTTGEYNTAIGRLTLASVTSGQLNTAVGNAALYGSTTGGANTGIGATALRYNTTGSYNTGIGDEALYSNTTASNNTAVGYQAGYTATVSSYNTFIGNLAGNAHNLGSAGNGLNTFVGYASGYYVTTGTANTIIGGYNGNQGGLDIRTASNYIVLSDGDGNPIAFGYKNSTSSDFVVNAFGGNSSFSIKNSNVLKWTFWNDSSNSDRLNITDADYSNGVILAQNSNSWSAYSDERLKQNIAPISSGIDVVAQLEPVTYEWKSQGKQDVGFIAQRTKLAAPMAVLGEEEDFYIDEEGRARGAMSIMHDKLIPYLVKAIQELNAKVEAQAAEIAALKGQA